MSGTCLGEEEVIVSSLPRISASKCWCFTVNNWTQEQKSELSRIFRGHRWIMAEEVGAQGTPHLQGFVKFGKAVRPLEHVKVKGVHWIKAKGNVDQNVTYCSKDGKVSGNLISRPLPEIRISGWQLMVDIRLDVDPDNRTIIWIWSRAGKRGKSHYVRYLAQYRDAFVCGGKAGDILFGIIKYVEDEGVPPKIVVLDCPRSNLEFLNYAALEQVKNGIWFSGKYESKMYIGPYMHVLCICNDQPDYTKISRDRIVEVCVD